MIRRAASAAALAVCAAPALGSETEAQAEQIEVCLEASLAPEDCIGDYIEACTTQDAGADTTQSIAACIEEEFAAWDLLLNRHYAHALDRMEEEDATGDILDETTRRTTSLRTAQRAWIAWRDAECALIYSRYGRGSLRLIAGPNCLMSMTALRAIELRGMHIQ